MRCTVVKKDPDQKGFVVLKRRWVVERTHAWFNCFRRLPIRYERRIDIYQAFSTLAASLITLNQIRRFC
jgi:transposase